LTLRSLARRLVSEGGFFTLRLLIASLFCLAGIFMVLPGIYSDSAKAQATTPAQPSSGSPTLVRMVGPVRQDKDLRSLPYIPPSPEVEERRLTRYPHPETGGPPPSQTSGFTRFQSLVEEALAPVPAMPPPSLTFDGMNAAQSGCSCLPPDSDGDVGPNHYVNVVNSSIKIFDKSGNPLNGANGTTFNSFFSALPDTTPCGNGENKGDPFVFYDHLANRWVVSDFAFPSFPGNSFYECIGVSQSPNPVAGPWALYAIQIDSANPNQLGDYPKFAMWNSGGSPAQNAYFFTVNLFTNNTTFNGVRAFALDRASMLTGGSAHAIAFTITAANIGAAYSLVPASFRTGNPPPAGRDEMLLAIDSPFSGGVTLTKVKGWKFHVDFSNPGNSTLGSDAAHHPNAQITVNGFVDAFTNNGTNLIPQSGTSQRLDTLGDKIMTPVVYQNRNGTESLWADHTVCTDVNCTGPTAVRWYQFNVTGGNFPATPAQQQSWTNGNDGLWRWMPSIAVNGDGNTAIGYSASSPARFPSIRYAGRLVIDALNNLAQGEAIMTVGGGAQTDPSGRWGDYSMTTVDPSDNKTFWHVNEYFPATAGASWFTRIGKFNFNSCTPAPSCSACVPGQEMFNDVPAGSPFCRFIEALADRGITGGCGGSNYCPSASVTRAQMAVFLLKTLECSGYTPPPCVPGQEMFNDVPASSPFCPWIEELARRGITGGCGGSNYCPSASVTRAQMAVFLLKTLEGSGYTPPPCVPGQETFNDVPASSPFCPWIEELVRRGITSGCGGGSYCPGASVTRAQMAVFLVRTFSICPFL
jgi:S-layer homology domain